MVCHLLKVCHSPLRQPVPFSNAYEWPLCCTALGARAIRELHALLTNPTEIYCDSTAETQGA